MRFARDRQRSCADCPASGSKTHSLVTYPKWSDYSRFISDRPLFFHCYCVDGSFSDVDCVALDGHLVQFMAGRSRAEGKPPLHAERQDTLTVIAFAVFIEHRVIGAGDK